jgi:hypothetical protein
VAQIYAALKSDEDTFKWLQAAYRDHAVWMEYLAVDPIFDRYRSDHRFQELLRESTCSELDYEIPDTLPPSVAVCIQLLVESRQAKKATSPSGDK